MQVGKRTTVSTFILYEEIKGFFVEKCFFSVTKMFLFCNQSYNCSVHCMAVSVHIPIVLHDGKYSNETKTVTDRTLKFPLPSMILTRLHRGLFCSLSQLRPLLPSLNTYTVRVFQKKFLVISI